MDDSRKDGATGSTFPEPGTLPWSRRDAGLLVLLLLIAVGLGAWHLTHTEVMARDSIGFIRIAWQLHSHPLREWPAILREAPQHPGYPLCILGVRPLVQMVAPGPEALVLQRSAQFASALASLFLVVAAYLLGRELFDRRVGFGVALLLLCLPVSGLLLCDGLSESVFLALAGIGLYLAVRALRTGSRRDFGLAGVFAGLAYLTRPEGLVIPAATTLVLLGLAVLRRAEWPLRRVVVCGVWLVASAGIVSAPLMASTGMLTVKPSARRSLWQGAERAPQKLALGQPLLALFHPDMGTGTDRTWWGVEAVGWELFVGFDYVFWAPLLIGVWCCFQRSIRIPGVWVLFLTSFSIAFCVWRVAVVVGYASDRHLLLVILSWLPWCVAGLIIVGEAIPRWLRAFGLPRRWLLSSPVAGILLLLVAAGMALPRTLEPLHLHRAGFRQAGLWLAENTRPEQPIVDPFYWSHYYAGRLFTEGVVPLNEQGPKYVVLERGQSQHLRLPELRIAQELARAGKVVFTWQGKRGKNRAEVIVVAVRPSGEPPR
jgi:hypothetical protein